MNRSVPPSPGDRAASSGDKSAPSSGDKARHLMFQPRRSSRSGSPKWFPSEGATSDRADQPDRPGTSAERSGDPAAGSAGTQQRGAGVGAEPAAAPSTAAPSTAAPSTAAPSTAAPTTAMESAEPESVAPEPVGPEPVGPEPVGPELVGPAGTAEQVGVAAALAAQTRAVELLGRRVEELARLRRHDADLVDRLHAENSRLRQGELTEALAPLLRGLIRIHDQMASLGDGDADGVAGILKRQLLQVLDLTVDVRPFEVPPGAGFDPARHVGVRGVPTDDPELDRTTVRTVKPGFLRGDSAVVRPAEIEVYRAD